MKTAAAFAVLLLAPTLARAQGAPATPAEPRTVTVSATATVSRAPDQAQILVGVESFASTARAAAQDNATKMDALIKTLKGAGIPADDIRTVSYQLNPEYDYPQPRPGQTTTEEPKLRGYRAVNQVQVTVDSVPRAGPLLDAVIQSGANRVNGISFQLKDPEAPRLDALRKAVAQARAEAEALADASGNRLGAVLEMTTGGGVRPVVMREMAAKTYSMNEPPPPTPVEPGDLEISASVTMTFRLESR